MRFLVSIALAALLALQCRSADTTLRRIWASSAYQECKEIPDGWLPATIPITETSRSAFQRLEPKDLSIRTLIARYGRPTRYLVGKKKDDSDFLIYDLQSGYSVAAYVAKPPHDGIAAVAIIDSEGKLIQLIK